MKLNKAQKEYLLDTMFEPGDIYKIFDSISRSWVIHQEIELKKGSSGWYDLYMNGIKYTSVNFKTYPEVLEQVL